MIMIFLKDSINGVEITCPISFSIACIYKQKKIAIACLIKRALIFVEMSKFLLEEVYSKIESN